jgi:uncharacterized protein YjiS (DUF1127 family)
MVTIFRTLEGALPAAASAGAALFDLPSRGLAVLRRWEDAWRMRQHLSELDDRTLRDLGITRAEALREASKPFWRR